MSFTDAPACFETPAPSLRRPLRGRQDRVGALEPPPLERKRDTTPEPFLFCPIIDTDLPFLDWPNLCNDFNIQDEYDTTSAFTLRPRTKLHPRSFSLFLSTSPQDHDRSQGGGGGGEEEHINSDEQEQEKQQQDGEGLSERSRRIAASALTSENATSSIENAPDLTLIRRCGAESAAFSSSFETKNNVNASTADAKTNTTTTMRQRHSVSCLQCSLDLMNRGCCSGGGGNSSIPRRNSLFHIPSSAASDGADANERRSPITDYLAMTMRLPGVAIGLSI